MNSWVLYLFPWSIYSIFSPLTITEKLLETTCPASLTRLVAPWWGWGRAVSQCHSMHGWIYTYYVSVIGSYIGHRRARAGGQQDSQKKVEQMEEENLIFCFLLMGIICMFYTCHSCLLFCGPPGAQWKEFCFKDEIEVFFVSMPASPSFSSENDSFEHSYIVLGLKNQ